MLQMSGAVLIVLLYSGVCTAQTAPLLMNTPSGGEIAPGGRRSYSVDLNAGDYIAGVVRQLGILIFATARRPDSSVIRGFPGPNEGERPFAFVADTDGRYHIELTTPTVENATRNGIKLPASGRFEIVVTTRRSLRDRLPHSSSDKYSSVIIDSLRKQLAAGAQTTDQFWKTARARGTPLVEIDNSDSRFRLVTFLWRGNRNTHHVLVLGSFTTDEYLSRVDPDNLMSNIESTDVWYLTIRLPAGAKFSYQISPNDPLVNEGPRADERFATAQVDTLNRRRSVTRPGATIYDGVSWAELPGTPTSLWTDKHVDVPSGIIERVQVSSTLLGSSRDVSIYTPAGYTKASVPCNLVVLFDGNYAAFDVPTAVTFDNLIAASKLAPTIVLFVASTAKTRAHELLGNEKFGDFVATELVPWVRARYRVTTDPRKVVLGGVSAGGVAAALTAFRFPRIFGNVLSQSGAFDWAPGHAQYSSKSDALTEPNGVAKRYLASPRLAIRFYLEAGVLETDHVGSGGFILEPNRHLRDVLLAKGYAVDYREFVGGHDPINWHGTLADGLVSLIGQK